MTEVERLRMYLRDSACTALTDVELGDLLDVTEDFNEAVGLGWLLIGSSLAVSTQQGARLSKTVGKVSETYGSSSAQMSATTAFKLAEYWFSRSATHTARWYSAEPSSGFIAETLTTIRAIEGSQHYPSLDLSRLIGAWW